MTDVKTNTPDAGDFLEEQANMPDDSSSAADQVVYWLRPNSDNMAILIDCPDPLTGVVKYCERIHEDLQKLEMPQYPDLETIQNILKNICTPGEDLIDHTLIMSQAPVQSKDGYLSWTKDYFAEGWAKDEDSEKINYREKIENCSVNRNELLLQVFHPFEGETGEDIFGNVIAIEKPEKISVRCGKGVSEVDQGSSMAYFSDIAGRVRFADNIVTVDEVYSIKGDVGLETGNIRHTGTVTIDGDVRSNSIIEVEGDVLVKGMVEESIIICGGSLTVAGGIIGGEGYKIRCGGNIESKYLRDVDVSADGDITVIKQISHSEIRCLGTVLIPHGRISGGTTTALRGIRTATAGSPGSTKTILKAGVDFSLEKQRKLHLEKIERLENLLRPIEKALNTALEKSENELSDGIKKVVENLAIKRMKMGESISEQYMKIDKLMEAAKEDAGYYVVMFTEVWSGTVIWLGENKTAVKRSIEKPRVVLLREDRVRVLPLGDENLPETKKSPVS